MLLVERAGLRDGAVKMVRRDFIDATPSSRIVWARLEEM
jgi:hypothetical protein